MSAVDSGALILAAVVAGQLYVAYTTATRLHERDADRRPYRTRVILVGVLVTMLAIAQYVVAQNTRAVLEAKVDDAENFARAAAHRVGVFAFKPGAGRRIADAARDLGAPNGTVPVNALADRDTSTVCVAIAIALRLGGWTVTDECVAGGLFEDKASAHLLSPVVVTYLPDQQARALAIAAALSREGVQTQALELDPLDRIQGAYPLLIVLRYL